MIISHTYKFVFIKTRKTAGTSTEVALSRYLGPNDIATEISPADELIRKVSGGSAQNFIQNVGGANICLMNHHSTTVARKVLGDAAKDYFFFTVERDPVEQAFSLWCYHGNHGSLLDFTAHAPRNSDQYCVGPDLDVDLVIPYPALDAGLEYVADKLGMPWDGDMPRCKSGITPDGGVDKMPDEIKRRISYELRDRERFVYENAMKSFGEIERIA